MKITFTIYAEPVPKARARTFYNAKAGRVMSYTPKKTTGFEQLISAEAAKHRPKSGLIMTGVFIEIKIFKSIPKSMSKKKRVLAEAGDLRPTTRPDIDNYMKSVFDALNKIIWLDDSQVVGCLVGKFFSTTPRTEVIIKTEEDTNV